MCQRLWCWWYFLLALKLSKNHINTVHIPLFICLLKVAQIIPYLFRFLFIARIFFFWNYTYKVSRPYCSQWISGSFHCIDWDAIKITGCYEILLHGSDHV